MLERPGRLVAVLLAALVAGGGLWMYARYDLTDRVARFHTQLDALGYARGGRLPTEEDAYAHVAAAADASGLELVEPYVAIEDQEGLDDAGRALERATATSAAGAAVAMEIRQYRFEGRVRGRRWIFAVDEPFDHTVTKRAQTTLVVPTRAVAPPPGASDAYLPRR